MTTATIEEGLAQQPELISQAGAGGDAVIAGRTIPPRA